MFRSSYDLDASTRDQAFLGGYVGDMASKQDLPEELLCWLLDTGDYLCSAWSGQIAENCQSVCLESRGDLRSSYVHTIEVWYEPISGWPG